MVRSELVRLTSSLTPLVTIIGLALVPVLYAGVYLYANWDPYGNLDQVQAALVNLDEGADFDGETMAIGDDVTEELVEEESFGWQQLDNREEAEAAVARGELQFALIIPEGFSAALASPAEFDAASTPAEQASLSITTNEANNFLLSSIVNVLAGEVHDSVAEQVGTETADQLLTGFGRIHQQISEAADGAGELSEGIVTLNGGIDELHAGAADLAEGADAADEGVDALSEGLGTLGEGTTALKDGASTLSTGADDLDTGLTDLETGAGELRGGADALSTGAADLSTGLSGLSAGAESVAEGNERLSAASHSASDVLAVVESVTSDAGQDAIQELLDAGVITAEQESEARDVVSSIAADADLAQRAEASRAELSAAQDSIDELSEGARDVADGAAALSAGSADLSTGADTLAEGIPALVTGLGDAASGAEDLSTGATALSSGAAEADAGVGELSTGAAELGEGTGALAEGADTLTSGLSDAAEGGDELEDGAAELAEGLDSGAEEVPNPDAEQRDRLAQVIGNPLEVDQDSQAEAGSYGAGMAPFFLGLSLWIGTLVMLQVLRSTSPRALASNASAVSIALGSWIPFVLLSLIQTLLLYAAVVFGVGLSPAHPWLALLVLFATSLAFSALLQGIVTLLGNPGKMLAIALLVLQLVASGGTFPVETLPTALKVLHPFLPLSYVVDALRHVIYGADLYSLGVDLAALAVTTVMGLMLLTVAVRRRKMWSLSRLKPAIEEAA